MTSEIIYLKQKCNRLIERAQEKELILQTKKQNRDKLRDKKDSLELQLKKIDDNRNRHAAENGSAINIADNSDASSRKYLMPILIPQRMSLINLQSENHPTVIEQELFPRIFEQQIRAQIRERENVCWEEDIWVEQPEPEEDDYYTYVNYRETDASAYKSTPEQRKYPGMPEETVIVYEHGDFYEFLRKLGYLLLFLLVLLLVAFAIIAIATTIFEEGMIPDGILSQIIL